MLLFLLLFLVLLCGAPSHAADTTPPAAPRQLEASTAVGFARVWLAWLAPTTDYDGRRLTGLSRYVIFRAPDDSTALAPIDTIRAARVRYTDDYPSEFSVYLYAVRALDSAGNLGPRSSIVAVKTGGIQPPDNLEASADSHYVELTWDSSTYEDLLGYNVYRSSSEEDGYERLAGTEGTSFSTYRPHFTDEQVVPGVFYYRLTAIGPYGESKPSASIQAEVPGIPPEPPLPPEPVIEPSPSKTAFKVVTEFASDLFNVSTEDIKLKVLRIVVIFIIVAIARIFMFFVTGISRFLVYSRSGPLKYIFRNQQRSITIHGLVISLIKYVVYFTALGYILKELGINYTTYIASLSVVGLAVGFGSQGLVQDIVTGFFILFENQFSVGDMVEISGQIGYVEDIGLRTTRIRNFFGAIVILQNRNIPMAGRYKKGGLEVGLDVALSDPAKAEQALLLLQRLGAEIARQFPEVVLETPHTLGLIQLETGEYFVRLKAKIWPMQQWVVDTQMLPRIRELFKRESIEIPGDRVVAFYHFPENEPETRTMLQTIEQIKQHYANYGPSKSGGKD